MKLEIEEVYLHWRNQEAAAGTLHVYLPDSGIDLRGLQWAWIKGKTFVKFPHAQALDENDNIVGYPLICFMSDEDVKSFRQQCCEEIQAQMPKLKTKYKTKMHYMKALQSKRKKRK